MGFSNILDNPFTSLAESFVKNVIMDKATPQVGSILKVDLWGGAAAHTGVYIGNGEIVELYEDNGIGEIRIVRPNRFLHGEPDSLVRTGSFIYCACEDNVALGATEIAERAKNAVGEKHIYELVGKNCHAFVSYCITGRKISNKKISDKSLWTLMGVENSLEERFLLPVNGVTWRSAGKPKDFPTSQNSDNLVANFASSIIPR